MKYTQPNNMATDIHYYAFFRHTSKYKQDFVRPFANC